MVIMKGEKFSAWSKVLHLPKYQLSSPTHNVEQSKSHSHIAYAVAFPDAEKDSEIFHMAVTEG